MKHLHLKYFTLLALFFALGIKAQAYDCCVDGIYYNLKDDVAEVTCEVIDHADCYSGSITIPSTITYKGKNYKVTKIGNKAFLYCHSLTSVSIPNSVTIIGDYAFQQCDELTKIEIPNGVTTLGNGVFRYCIKLQSINFPNSVTSIGIHTFTECHALTSVTLPEHITTIGDYFFSLCYSLSSFEIPQSVTSIGNFAFKGCAELSSIAIPNSVTSIGKCAFQLCQGLTSVEIGSGVTSIGNNTFKDCDNLTSVTFHCVNIGDWFAGIESIKEIVIGDEVKNIGYSAFRGCSSVESVILGDNVTKIEYDAFGSINTDAKFYVNRGTPSLLALWTAGLKPYEIGTGKKLMPPYLELVKVTQSTATLKIKYMYKDYVYSFNGQIMTDSLAVVKGLLPEHQYSTSLSVSLGDVTYHSYDTNNFWTDKISPSVYKKRITASSITVGGNYIHGDADVVKDYLTIENTQKDGNTATFTGLNPKTQFNATYSIVVRYGNDNTYTYTSSKTTISTEALSLITQQPKVISAGNVIVAAKSNLDDAEENVGFEWRRTDWTDDFASNSGTAYLYEGTMEGYIRNLYTEKLWKYRPFYTSASGRTSIHRHRAEPITANGWALTRPTPATSSQQSTLTLR